ncbi:MAG: anthranilate synthase component I family protein [Chitinophagaceae bacterium]|nr:anthranilate synthase component I family protein [Chitinophagaceae bacterium]
MTRTKAIFAITNYSVFKQQMLSWANQFNICCFLDNHQYQTPYNSVECLLAVNAVSSFTPTLNTLNDFTQFEQEKNDWLFGHVSYDFKNELHGLTSNHHDGIQFPDFFFFQPETVIKLSQESVEISCINNIPESVFKEIGLMNNEQLIIDNEQRTTNSEQLTTKNEQRKTSNEQRKTSNEKRATNIITPRITKEIYLQTIEQLKKHILRGDCYEINFCQEFYTTNVTINPLETYQKLAEISPNPFSCYYKLADKFLLCASPERYIKKQGTQIITQPIKGTFKRNLADPALDAANKHTLQNSSKDKAENVMVVDLVRNDLSKICTEGSVKVDELFKVYTFPQVYQMISTISGTVAPQTNFADVLAATFPMGSMTGAPKQKVMELTEQYEQTKRGIYSGCVGYIAPNKDFDFNVVIRSIMYNAQNQYLSYQVGGGITYNSHAESEYEECLLKAEAMKKVLE